MGEQHTRTQTQTYAYINQMQMHAFTAKSMYVSSIASSHTYAVQGYKSSFHSQQACMQKYKAQRMLACVVQRRRTPFRMSGTGDFKCSKTAGTALLPCPPCGAHCCKFCAAHRACGGRMAPLGSCMLGGPGCDNGAMCGSESRFSDVIEARLYGPHAWEEP
jgi:hypothetical protein